MKKLLAVFLISILLVSCQKGFEDVRKVKVGISANELKYIMGEPRTIDVQNGSEEWSYQYSSHGMLSPTNTLYVTVVNDKVTNFKSY